MFLISLLRNMEECMAVVSSSASLSTGLASGAPLVGDHVWLDKELGLVTGSYPTPNAKFDFGEERLVPLKTAALVEPKQRVSHLAKARRVGVCYELETENQIHTFGNATQLLVEGLNLIEDFAPGTLQSLSMKKGRTKRPVAKSREELYDVLHPASHSEKLNSGFFVATNNKSSESRWYLRQAAEIAGLKWGENFKVRPIK